MTKQYEIRPHERPTGERVWYVWQTNSRKRCGECAGYARTPEGAEAILAQAVKLEEQRQAKLAARRRSFAEYRNAGRVKVCEQLPKGAMLHTSWGYEQTNVEFFEVVGRFGEWGVILREVASTMVRGTGPFSAEVRPRRRVYVGSPLRRMIGGTGVKIDENRTAYPCGDRETFHCSWGH